MDINFLNNKAKSIRKKAFEMVIKAGKGHLGGSLSCTEILVALYYGMILKFDPKRPDWEFRDRLIFSKGHANNTLYVILADLGFFPMSELDNYTKDGCLLGNHCDDCVPGVEVISGSLGHGLGIASGIALGAKLTRKDYMTFVILGDGECQEGSVWEAAMFAGHHSLNNLVAIIDRNNLGSEDFTENTSRLENLEDKWLSFGWNVRTIDGHSFESIFPAFEDCRSFKTAKPLMIIAKTIKGKGISSLENTPKSHHTLPNEGEILKALKELE